MDNPMLSVIQLFAVVNGLSQHIEQTSQSLLSHRNRNACSCSRYLHISAQAFAGSQHNTAHCMISSVLGHFHYQFFALQFHSQGVLNGGKVLAFEFYIYYRSHNLYDFTFIHMKGKPPSSFLFLFLRLSSADYLCDFLGNGSLTDTIIFNG